MTSILINSGQATELSLPDYVFVNLKQKIAQPSVLRTTAQLLSFPLSENDLESVKLLEKKFDNEENCAGLAAPQIGISKQIIIISVPDDPKLKKWRKHLTQTIPKTIWINPSYHHISTEKYEDYEGCFSVEDVAGLVSRYKTIRYLAYDINGQKIEGIAEGFLARLIQHEIDHLNGKLFIDYVVKDQLFSLEEYRNRRQKAMEMDKS